MKSASIFLSMFFCTRLIFAGSGPSEDTRLFFSTPIELGQTIEIPICCNDSVVTAPGGVGNSMNLRKGSSLLYRKKGEFHRFTCEKKNLEKCYSVNFGNSPIDMKLFYVKLGCGESEPSNNFSESNGSFAHFMIQKGSVKLATSFGRYSCGNGNELKFAVDEPKDKKQNPRVIEDQAEAEGETTRSHRKGKRAEASLGDQTEDLDYADSGDGNNT